MSASAERWDKPAALAVGAVWAAMLLGGLLFIHRFASNVPSWDDWDMVPTLTGVQPVTLEWLWSQHNEHRVPVPRLLYLGLNWLTVVDFRTSMYFDLVAMAGLAAAMIVVARRLRGRTSLTDVFLPLLLLHWGQAANLLWGWQLQFFISVVLSCIALLAITGSGTLLRPRTAALTVGACAVLLTLCGANGLGLVPMLALWPLALAYLPSQWTGLERRDRRALVLVSVAAFLLSALYFVGWQAVPYHPKSHSIHQSLKTAVQFLTIGFGPASRDLWPVSGYAVILTLVLTAFMLAVVLWKQPGERARATGLLCFLGAQASLALGLSLGRDGFETRYVTLAIPLWCCAYFAWTLYGPGPHGVLVRGMLAVAAAAALWPNTAFGLDYAGKLRGQLRAFELDMAGGVPIHELIHRYGPWLHPHQDIVADYLLLLRRANVGAYGRLREDPPFRAVPIKLDPLEQEQLRFSDSTAQVVGPNPALLFELPADRYVTGIRLTYQYRSEDGTLPYIGIRWKPSSQPEFVPERYYKYSPTGDRANWERGGWTRLQDPGTTLTIWICDTVRQLGITPDFRPAVFRITELSLLEPME